MTRVQPGLAAVISRREAISAGGLAIAGTVGRTSTPAPTNRIIFGANRGNYAKVNAAIPLAIGQRIYYGSELPTAWPNPFPGGRITLSLQPDPDDLLSGQLDDQLNAIIDSAPAHSELAFWHENITGNPLGYPPHVNNARTAVDMQNYGQQLCLGTQVRFGVITCGPAIQQLDWMASGLDWYGDDLYDFPRLRNPDGTLNRAKIFARLNSNLDAWRQVSGKRWPAIRICETNSPYDSHRTNWFTWVAQWMSTHNGRRILTYWNPDEGIAQHGLSGPWPPSKTVVTRLRLLSEAFQGNTA